MHSRFSQTILVFIILVISCFRLSLCFGSDSEQLSGFCFTPSTNLEKVKSRLRPILLAKDKLHERSSMNCIELKLSEARMGLFETYLGRHFSVTQTYRGNQTFKAVQETRQCRAEILEQEKLDKKTNTIGIGGTRSVHAKNEEEDLSKVKKSVLLLSEGMPGNLKINDHSIDLVCFLKPNNYAEIVIRLQNNNQGLSSTIRVKKGQRINLGDIVQDLNHKDKSLSSQTGIKYGTQQEHKAVSYFMTIF